MFKSIRTGLFAALAGFTVLICVAYTGLALVIAYVTEDMLVDRLLAREARAITTGLAATGQIPPPANDLIRIYRNVEALPAVVRQQVMTGHERGEVFTDTGQHYHLRTLELRGAEGPQRLYLLADVGPLLVVTKLIQDVGGVLIAVALGLIALALLLAYLLSKRLVSPLQVLAREVRQVGIGRDGIGQDRRVAFSASQRRDEIGYLADRLGATIAELQTALAREHAFTRDVSHELRTPLTVMHNILGGRQPGQDELAQLRDGVAEIGNTIDVLFALARAEHIAHETLDLRGCIEDSLLRLLEHSGWDDDQLALQLPDRLAVRGNRQLCILLMNNCLGNAVFHGGANTRLVLRYADGVLSIANSIDPARDAAMQGFLHGQNLLRRIAQSMGWGLTFHADATSYQVDIVPLPAD